MRPAFWLALALLPTLAVAQPARAAKAKAPAQDAFSELFDTACMQHIGAPARLQSLMESNGLSPLQPAEAATLLQGQSGVAWMVPLASGRYAVSWADDGTCTVYAEKADAAAVSYTHLINDSHGHRAGDEVLRHIASTLRAFARPGDTPARLGGDEFVVLLRDCAPIDAMHVAERVRLQLLEAARQATPGIEFSVSIGIAATPRGGSVEDWLALADRALYHAKRQGKNTASYGE